MAVEMPVRDQPVSSDIGCRNTASENIEPMLTQVISARGNDDPAESTHQPVSCAPPRCDMCEACAFFTIAAGRW